MALIQKTYTFSPNTVILSEQVNQNFDDIINILKNHHHDPNIYTNASPITNSGIAENAEIGKINQNQIYTITASGKIQSNTALQILSQPGIISVDALPYDLGSKRLQKLEIDNNLIVIDRDASGNLTFKDENNPTPKTLTDLSGGDILQTKTVYSLEPINIRNAVSLGAGGGLNKAAANDIGKVNRFIGFAQETVTASGILTTIYTHGIVSGFTGLSAGSIYYLSDTAGAISTTPGTYKREVGIALTSSDLLIINKAVRQAQGSGTRTTTEGSGTITITTGFRPKYVIIGAKSDSRHGSIGVGTDSRQYCFYSDASASEYTTIDSSNIINAAGDDSTTGPHWKATITIKETGFDLTFSPDAGIATDLSYYWIAIG